MSTPLMREVAPGIVCFAFPLLAQLAWMRVAPVGFQPRMTPVLCQFCDALQGTTYGVPNLAPVNTPDQVELGEHQRVGLAGHMLLETHGHSRVHQRPEGPGPVARTSRCFAGTSRFRVVRPGGYKFNTTRFGAPRAGAVRA